MFHQANNVSITGGRFTNIVNNQDPVSTILWQHVASGAIFDSAERYPAGKCHPGTREKIIEHITSWIKDPNPAQKILWLYGAAGAGKSSLIQTLCEGVRDLEPGLNGGSFFFARDHPARGNAKRLFATLSYQLAIQFPPVRAAINNAISQDPSLPTKSIDIQLRSLIIEPLLAFKDSSLSATPTLFIDGLDECDGAQGIRIQCQIINLISQCIINHNIPVRFIIASRPEYWIRDLFETSPLSETAVLLSLRDSMVDADNDVRVYLTENFDKIRQENRRIMKDVALPWPPPAIINRFVDDASGQIIYASTVIKFVGNDSPFNDPEEQLRIITTPGPHRAPAFSELDKLYATISAAYPRWESMKRVLCGLIVNVTPPVIQGILGVSRKEITLVLDALTSLIRVSPTRPLSEDDQLLAPIFGTTFLSEQISFYHLSFKEFLQDEARSGLYHISYDNTLSELAQGFLGIIQRNLDQNYETEPHILCKLSISEYRRMMSDVVRVSYMRSGELPQWCEYLIPIFTRVTESLMAIDRDVEMNNPACFVRDMQSLRCFLENIGGPFQHKGFDPSAANQNTPPIDSFLEMIKRLLALACDARRIGFCILWTCQGFSINRTLVAIGTLGLPLKRLATVPGISRDEIISTVHHHRHIIDLKISPLLPHLIDDLHWEICLVDVDFMENGKARAVWMEWINHRRSTLALETNKREGWLNLKEWTNHRVSLVSECLKTMISTPEEDWEIITVTSLDVSSARYIILARFLDDCDASDIQDEDYLRNKYYLSFLEIILNSKAWTSFFPSRPRLWTTLHSVINPLLGWFNRQLTNPKTIELMDFYDNSLRQRMTTAMECMFQHCFLPIFQAPYNGETEISMSPPDGEEGVIKMHVLNTDRLGEVIGPSESHPFHVPLFLMREVSNTPPPIPISHWYPYLAAHILSTMVKSLYQPLVGISDMHLRPLQMAYRFMGNTPFMLPIFDTVLPYMVKYLRYAQTTPQNLDALRAIRYLSQQMHLWNPSTVFNPPTGFCSETKAFLEKYDGSDLPSEELDIFNFWLSNIEEFDGLSSPTDSNVVSKRQWSSVIQMNGYTIEFAGLS